MLMERTLSGYSYHGATHASTVSRANVLHWVQPLSWKGMVSSWPHGTSGLAARGSGRIMSLLAKNWKASSLDPSQSRVLEAKDYYSLSFKGVAWCQPSR